MTPEDALSWLKTFGHNYIEEVLLTILIAAMAFAFNRIRSWIAWRSKQFDMVTFSLHTFRDGKLFIDTVLEDSLMNVFHSDTAIKLVLDAAEHTTAEKPLLPLPDTPETGVILTALLNALSERFADGALAWNMGLPVVTSVYYLALTWEHAKGFDRDVRKLRVVIIKQDDLRGLPETAPELLEEQHATRWYTLRVLKEHHAQSSHLLKLVRLSVQRAP